MRLRDRDGALTTVDSALAGARGGAGRLVFVEGAAGTGKSTLLAELHRRAGQAGFRTLAARGGRLERDYPYGVLRQAFEPLLHHATDAERRAMLANGAAPAGALLGLGTEAGDLLASLLGIYWLVANLAAGRPLLLTIDDAHWADDSSLLAFDHLARRAGDLPVLLVTAVRPAEPGAPAGLLDELRAGAAARIGVGPLPPAAVAELVREQRPDAGDELCGAFHATTAGNPFYLAELLATTGADATPEQVRAAALPSLADRLLLRIGALGPDAPALARAMAVLGDGTHLHTAAALAGLEPARADDLAHRLRRLDVLAAENPFAFAHPLVRSSLYDAMSVGERDAAHVAAGELLQRAGAPPAQVAAQFGACTPSGSATVATALLAAAEQALAGMAPAEAAHCLRRALAEEAPAPPRGELLGRLGLCEHALGYESAAITHLREALDVTEDRAFRTRVGAALAEMSFVMGRAGDALEAIAAVAEDADEDGRAELAVVELMAVRYHPGLQPVLDLDEAALDALCARPGHRAGTLAGMRAGLRAHHRPRADVDALIDRALDGELLLAAGIGGGGGASHAIVALVETEQTARALQFADELNLTARRSGAANGMLLATSHRGWVHARRGDLAAAEGDLRHPMRMAAAPLVPAALATMILYAEDVLLERPSAEDLVPLVDGYDVGPMRGTVNGAMVLLVRGRLRLLRRETDFALADLRHATDVMVAADMGPMASPIRSVLALALPPAERDEADALVAEDLRLARAVGYARPEGIALRAAGVLAGDVELLRASVDVLAPVAAARLELARSQIELGATLRRAGHRVDARAVLAPGIETAAACGATRLAERGRDELRAAGGRPRRTATRGRDALTASELRVAVLAAGGATNVDIAQELFVSIKTVETHLSRVYRKLGLAGQGSRERLREVLAVQV